MSNLGPQALGWRWLPLPDSTPPPAPFSEAALGWLRLCTSFQLLSALPRVSHPLPPTCGVARPGSALWPKVKPSAPEPGASPRLPLLLHPRPPI